MKLAIVTYPTSERSRPSLAKDVELVRASILYADEIELVSLGAVMIAAVVQLAADDSNMLSMMSSLDDETIRSLGGGGLPDNWREILPIATVAMQLDPATLRRLPGGDQIDQGFFEQQRELRRGLDEAAAKLRTTAQNLLIQSGGDELLPAIEAGIVKLSPSGFAEDGDSDETIEGWVELLKTLLRDPTTRLLFDDRVGDLVRSLVGEGQVEPHQLTLKHAGEAAVGSGLVARLPALPQAPVDELLDLRRDLEPPLARYRAAVSRLADRLVFRSFDSESAAEIDDMWVREVAPALVEIEEGFAEHGLVREVARTLGADLKILIGGGASAWELWHRSMIGSHRRWRWRAPWRRRRRKPRPAVARRGGSCRAVSCTTFTRSTDDCRPANRVNRRNQAVTGAARVLRGRLWVGEKPLAGRTHSVRRAGWASLTRVGVGYRPASVDVRRERG